MYYFEEADKNKLGHLLGCNSTFVSRDSEPLLWHNRLVHPCLKYLKYVLPSIFINKTCVVVQGESCEFVKH